MHESWTVQDGLPVNSIIALVQSRDGYIWIATFDGLVRFDGVRFTVFNSANSPGLPSNRITNLHEGRDGSLWLRTEQSQLIRFRDGVFSHFGPDRALADRVFSLYEDTSGAIWVGTERGLGLIRGERFVAVADQVIRGRVGAIIQRADGTIWAGLAAGGLFRIEGGRATAIGRESELASDEVTSLYEDPQGTLWIGTGGGIWRYDDDAPERLVQGAPSWRAVGSRAVGFRASPRTGEVWALTATNVYRLGRQGPTYVLPRSDAPYTAEVPLPDEAGRMLYTSGPELHRDARRIYVLPPDAAGRHSELQTITAVVLDHEGSLWLGTRGHGLHRLKPSLFTVYSEAEGLSHRNVYSVYEDRAGDVWIGTIGTEGGGGDRISAGRITRLTAAQGYPASISSFLQDRAGRLWIGDGRESGVGVCSPGPTMQCEQPTPNPVGAASVRAIYEDADGAIWFGTTGGLLRYDRGIWARFPEADGAPASTVRAFLQTRDGALWMGTIGGGVARYQGGRFTQITTAQGLPFDLVRSLYQDEDGWLWVGTEGRGLARLDPRQWESGSPGGRIVSYGTKDGLFDEVIHQVLEDDFGRLWMSGNRGIFWVERRELLAFAEGRLARINSTGYTERDGLRNREANGGVQPAGVKARDGRLWFPTQDGVAVVDPARIQRNRTPPNVVIEQVIAGGMAVRPGRGAQLELGVKQRDLEIEYTALSFQAPANMRFRYRLEPYDADWVDAAGRRTAFYTRVPPGRYTFRVIASNNAGVWNEQGAALELRFAPHFRETAGFRVLSVLAVGLALAGGVGWRVQRLRARAHELSQLVEERTAELREHQRRLEAQAVQLREVDRAKSHFFANVSHEFRTPLTLILGPLRDVSEGRFGQLSDALRRQVNMMTRNAQRLLRHVNQVLDLARLESGTLERTAEVRDLVELAATTTRAFTPLAEQRRIALAFRPEAERLPVEIDADQMEKVLLNLLSNAFKFTEPGGHVEVTAREEEGHAVLEVRDTGIGIAAEQLPRVFDRFYQADSSATRRHEGTGIGLSLVKELVDLHGGTVTAESQPGVGSTFHVRLPLLPAREAAPSASVPEPGTTHRELPTGEFVRVEPELASIGAPAEETEALDVDQADRTTVLIVDDNVDIRAYVRSVLETGFHVIEATDGQEGLDRARQELPDLVIADVMMPRLDGFALARALREDPSTDCIPTILLTARAGAEAEVEGLGTGTDDYITKPFHAGVLEARVTNLIANRRRLRDRFREEGVPAPAAPAVPTAPRSALEVQLRSIIEANLTEPEFRPETLAAEARLSYGKLYRRLAADLDATPSQFIRTVRVERAAELLRSGAGSVTEVAYSVGFNSLSHFHRTFRERFGTSPVASLRVPA